MTPIQFHKHVRAQLARIGVPLTGKQHGHTAKALETFVDMFLAQEQPQPVIAVSDEAIKALHAVVHGATFAEEIAPPAATPATVSATPEASGWRAVLGVPPGVEVTQPDLQRAYMANATHPAARLALKCAKSELGFE